jgi:hypothetical protein
MKIKRGNRSSPCIRRLKLRIRRFQKGSRHSRASPNFSPRKQPGSENRAFSGLAHQESSFAGELQVRPDQIHIVGGNIELACIWLLACQVRASEWPVALI